MSWDPYAALGVSKSSSASDIRKSYRKLAKELHPDARPNDAASAERFKRVTAAFNLLSDSESRARYDRGEIDADGNERPVFHGGAQPGFGGFSGFGGTRSRAGRADVFEDLFDGLFSRNGGARGFAGQRGEDVRYRMDVDFLDAVNGGRRRVTMSDGRPLELSIQLACGRARRCASRGRGCGAERGRAAMRWSKSRCGTIQRTSATRTISGCRCA